VPPPVVSEIDAAAALHCEMARCNSSRKEPS